MGGGPGGKFPERLGGCEKLRKTMRTTNGTRMLKTRVAYAILVIDLTSHVIWVHSLTPWGSAMVLYSASHADQRFLLSATV